MIATIILGLHLLGLIPLSEAVILMFIAGAMLIVADVFVISLGVLSLNGIIALIMGYILHTGPLEILGVPLDWGLFLGVALLELIALVAIIFAFLKNRGNKSSIGVESMIGAEGTILEWDGTKGRVHVQGEAWKAASEKPLNLQKEDAVKIIKVKNLTLFIESTS